MTAASKFVRIPNATARDQSLSLGARGLLAMLLSHSANFSLSERWVLSQIPEGRERLRGYIRELKAAKYLHIRPRFDAGQLAGSEWLVAQSPVDGFPGVREPRRAEKPACGNSGVRDSRPTGNPSDRKPVEHSEDVAKEDKPKENQPEENKHDFFGDSVNGSTPKPSKRKGTEEELRAYAFEIGLLKSDGSYLCDKWEGNGWTNDGKPIKDWRATMRSWKRLGILPSQRATEQQNERHKRGII
jgi:hypothetical protein